MKTCSLLVLVAFLCVSAFGGVVVEVGDTEIAVLQRNPDVLGSGMMQGKKMLMYSDARVFLEDGVVVSFDGNAKSEQSLKREAEQKKANERKKREFEQKQRDRGLILYCGSWVTPEEKEKDELNKAKIWSEKVAKHRAMLLESKTELLKLKAVTQSLIRNGQRSVVSRNIGRVTYHEARVGTASLEMTLATIEMQLIDIDSELEKLK